MIKTPQKVPTKTIETIDQSDQITKGTTASKKLHFDMERDTMKDKFEITLTSPQYDEKTRIVTEVDSNIVIDPFVFSIYFK